MTTNNSVFLQAFDGTNKTVPVWFMRQAGRYLKEYQEIKKQHPLEEMFSNPALASEITCQPIDILKVDAAILFADILTLPKAMGIDIHFDNKKGPIVGHIKNINDLKDFDDLPNLRKTIELINQRLDEHIPLIGFAGSPFTVLTYIMEGGSSQTFIKTLDLMFSNSELFHQLMEKLTINTIRYSQMQEKAGIKAFQLFDTWAGILSKKHYDEFVLPYIIKIFNEISVPSIYFVKNCSHLVTSMNKTSANFLSVCHTVTIGSEDLLEKTDKGIQGNLFNGLLYGDEKVIRKSVVEILTRAQSHKKYIFNFNHGFLPTMDVEKAKIVVEEVHKFPWKI